MKPDWCFYPRTYNRRTKWCFKETDLSLIELLETILKSRQSIEAVYGRVMPKRGLKFKELLSGLGFLQWIVHESQLPKLIVGSQRPPSQFEKQLPAALAFVTERLEVAARNRESGKKSRTTLNESDRGWLVWLIVLVKERLEDEVVAPQKTKAKHKKQTQKASQTRQKETQIRLETCLRTLQNLGVKITPTAIHKASGISYKAIREHLEFKHPV